MLEHCEYDLTIFTATYNRDHLLSRVYQSIIDQEFTNIEWLIIDDGSSDNTAQLVKQWKAQKKIPINYYYQKNGGKSRAYNLGIEKAKGKFFLTLDSDDYLLDNSKEKIYRQISLIRDKKNVIGAFSTRDFGYDRSVRDRVPNMKLLNIMDLKFQYGLNVENTALQKTDILKQYRFPTFEGEKFSSPEMHMHEVAQKYTFIYTNEVIVGGTYQADGETSSVFKSWIDNPRGTYCLLNSRYSYLTKVKYIQKYKELLKCLMNLGAYNIKLNKVITYRSPNKLMSLILIFPSYLWYLKRFKKI
ncbi:glycosyltransferase family A protein [Enterococcus pallens]|uniref:Glycosyltransferase 2-like domain-containing protein n=1 Tax=Enterococcus pallens ATCC BAA-351 TaxID=1158607 RepID=R2QEJ3_9ENTE|nr:glycosyltransferase family 2 protein [Enterococcus pallens]EOH94902.1 hypothetical protein UAU_01824 [Enterococcus pallens ATCC BAA-351]EOU14779.1 hypothetical protein I588_04429 [Enterococcus pallens ATCC BAA-351]OJG77186.1 hypothetical protein RV10_GL002925 [Enterococcus pallens]